MALQNALLNNGCTIGDYCTAYAKYATSQKTYYRGIPCPL